MPRIRVTEPYITNDYTITSTGYNYNDLTIPYLYYTNNPETHIDSRSIIIDGMPLKDYLLSLFEDEEYRAKFFKAIRPKNLEVE